MCGVGNSFYLRDDVGEALPEAHLSEEDVAVGRRGCGGDVIR